MFNQISTTELKAYEDFKKHLKEESKHSLIKIKHIKKSNKLIHHANENAEFFY